MEHTLNHTVNLCRVELSDRVVDRDVGGAAGRLFRCSDLEDTVGRNIKLTFKYRITRLHRWQWRQCELAQRCVVLAIRTLTLVHGEHDALLCIGDSCECPCEVSVVFLTLVYHTNLFLSAGTVVPRGTTGAKMFPSTVEC